MNPARLTAALKADRQAIASMALRFRGEELKQVVDQIMAARPRRAS
jgi:hypothetical protein